MKPRVGFAGMGIMGKPMAANIAKAGYTVGVYNRTRPSPESVGGLPVYGTARELAQDSDMLVIMVTGPEALDFILWGENGMGPALGQGKTVINMSTVSPAYTEDAAGKVKATGAVFIDAPVSGSKVPAQQGALVFLAGGARRDLDALEPLLLSMGRKVVACGPAPSGSMMKMAVNLLLGSMMSGLAEMLTFGQAGGLSREAMLGVVLDSPLGCELFRLKEQMLLSEKYLAQFPLKHMAKDLTFVTDTANALHCPVPGAYTDLQLYSQGVSKGLGELDFAAVMQVLQGMI